MDLGGSVMRPVTIISAYSVAIIKLYLKTSLSWGGLALT